MKNRIFPVLVFFAASFLPARTGAQSFGFGSFEEDRAAVPQALPSPLKITGGVRAELMAYFDEIASPQKIKAIEPGNIFRGKLNLSVTASSIDVFIGLELSPVFDGSSPVKLGEAYGRASLGSFTLEAGMRKLSWGRADSFGPLDLINPLDYSDLSRLSAPQDIKVPRPMLHAIWNMGLFSRVEAVFVPWFQGHTFAASGRWSPAEIKGAGLGEDLIIISERYKLKYAQAGLRFTSTAGSSDLGFQYYFGRLPRPAGYDPHISFTGEPAVIIMDYNCFHHFGIDSAMVIAGFNARAELGANITEDLYGNRYDVYNPAIVYSLGFDRGLPLGINLNLQGSGSIRLFHEGTKEWVSDIEAGMKISSTRITGILSRKFLRDELELKAAALLGIEDRDFLIMPSAVWSRNDLSAELSAGFFGGKRNGELGQYRGSSYARVILSCCF
jgi:hypothetical protein